MNLYNSPGFRGGCQLAVTFTSFVGAFRTLWVILENKHYRKQKSFQLMANIAFLECLQMTVCFIGGLMVVDENLVSLAVNKALGCVLISVWIGLVYLRLFLALNRFSTITQYNLRSPLNRKLFHWGCTALSWTLILVSLYLLIAFWDMNGLYMDSELAVWLYYESDVPFHQFDRYSSLSCASIGFCLYVFTFIYIFKHRGQGKDDMVEIRLFFAFAATFGYEIGNVLTFNVIPEFITMGNEAFRIMSLTWLLLPAFNCIMLLSINCGFRKSFFTFPCYKQPNSLFGPRVSVVGTTSITPLGRRS